MIALGCMGMTGFYGPVDRTQCIQTIRQAFDLGVRLFDTADNYGVGENEVLLGEAVASFRNQITLSTKVGVLPRSSALNGKSDYIKEQCEKSLKRLGVSSIDLYYLHHADPATPIEESIQAMVQLKEQGKVRQIGLGELSLENIRRAHKTHPIAVVQAEYSLFFRSPEKSLIPLCKELGIRFLACAPLSRGLLGGASFESMAATDFRRKFPRFEPENLKHNLKIVGTLKKFADAKSSTLAQLALSWVSSQSIQPLVGTTSHIEEDVKKIPLSQHEIEALKNIAVDIRGHRLTEFSRHLYETD